MSIEYCKISLKKLTGIQSKPGYQNSAIKALLGSTRVNPCLPYSRSEFFQSSKQYAQGMSISGVQQKLSLKIDENHALVACSGGGEYILKPSPEAYPYAAENEHAAMQLSRLMGIDTAECGLVSFKGGELAYLTRRFDCRDDGSKLHQEDLMQCFNLPSEDKYGKTYEQAGKLIFEVTHGKQAAVLDFVRRVILAYVTGNDDLHLKNLSVQRLPDNLRHDYDKLSPNYDCLFCDAFTADVSGMGLMALGLLYDPQQGDEYVTGMYQHYGYYTGYDFLELGRRLGLPEKPIRSFITRLLDQQQNMTDLIKHSYMPEEMKARAGKLLASRIRVMQMTQSTVA